MSSPPSKASDPVVSPDVTSGSLDDHSLRCSSSSAFTRRPDAAMRCNFRFRLDLAIVSLIVVCLGTSAGPVSSNTAPRCRSGNPPSFDDVVSRAALARVVFEGQVIASNATAVACYTTFKVKRLFKGDLSKNNRAKSAVESSSSSPSSDDLFSPVVVRTSRDDAVNGNWCSGESPSTRILYVIFLSIDEAKESDSGGSTSPKALRRNSRIRDNGNATAVLYKFSSLPVVSSKTFGKQLVNVGSAKAPVAKLKQQTKGKQSANQSHRVGSRIQLNCRAVGRSKLRNDFVWTKDGECIQSNIRLNITIDKAKMISQLLIKSSTTEDRGVYGCQVINAVGHSSVQTVSIGVDSPDVRDLSETVSKSPLSRIDEEPVVPPTTHQRPCDKVEKHYCMNRGVCYVVTQLNKKLCHCPVGFEGPRCQERQNGLNPDEDIGKSNVRMSLLRKKRMHAPVT